MTKKEMRALIAQRVKNLSPVYCREADEAICRLVRQADCYRTAQTVFCYAGSEREIDTMGLLHALLSDGKTVALPLCREVGWDFQRGVPRFRGGVPVEAAGKEAVKVWIWKAIRTPRFRYEIYSWAYGSEFETLLGQAYSDAVKTAEAPRYLRECLLVNPYITDVKDISVTFEAAKLTVEGTAVTIYGEVKFHGAV